MSTEKMLQLIRQSNPIPAQFESAWRTIWDKSPKAGTAMAAFTMELQNLLTPGRASELW